MPARLYLRSFWILTFLWGIVFVLAMVLAYFISTVPGVIPEGMEYLIILIPVVFAFIVVGFQFLISPWIMDITISWVYQATKYQVDELPAHIRNFLHQQMELHNFSLKWVAIIHDNNPNAFTYGHTKKRARLAITEGILNYLDETEQIAVVAHECGHIIHRDFIWMTVAAAIPLICYSFYQGLWTFARVSSRTSRDDDAAKVSAVALVVAIGAWIAYYVSHFLVLFLSRVREYYADSFSAEATGDPGALSRALVKIAYGMVKEDAATQERMRDESASPSTRKQASKVNAFNTGMRSLGIFDVSGARNLAMSAYGRGVSELNEETVAKAAQWDLSNPWGGFLELFSTHPLPAKRIRSLNKMQEERGLKPEFPGIGEVKLPESLWDEFFIDLFLSYIAPLLFFILPLVGAFVIYLVGESTGTLYDPAIGVGIGLLLFALIWKWRRREKYPKIRDGDETVTVVHALTDHTKNSYYEASPLRGKKAVFEGRVVGRGIPGYWLSEDLVIKDKTGLITLDYSPILGFMSWIFALFRVPGLQGRNVKAYGWYHRTPTPVLSVWKIITEDGRTYKNRWSGLNWLFMWFVVLIGLFFLISGLAISFV
ncbi:MAG: M48 family metalloprotease [Candidatus Heimdallarchaeota archaeon]|nr:MAG: M48 family metalloprotease [Candidatus Heimdallarchaeota archaeon]